MRILITGGLGFFGGRLAVHLTQAGHRIVLGSRKANVPPAWLPQAEVAQINWDDADGLNEACKGIDVVIHTAGMNAQDCAADPVAALAFNGLATARLVAAAVRVGVSRFVYLSTVHVYASPLVGVITEDTCPRNLHPYATSHLAGENAVLTAGLSGQIQGIVLRLSNVFGTPVHKDVNCWILLVNDLCRQAVKTHKLVLQNSTQKRDFISMTEVCRVTERLAIGRKNELKTAVFNIGAGLSQSVLTMAKTVQQRCAHVLDYEPMISLADETHGIAHGSFVYSTSRLIDLGIRIDNSIGLTEIDDLLLFCRANFNK